MHKHLIDSNQLRNRLKLKSFQSEKKLLDNHPTAKKFFQNFKLHPGKIRAHAANLLTSSVLAGTVLLSSHTGLPSLNTGQVISTLPKDTFESILPKEIGSLTLEQENKISDLIKRTTGLNAVASLDGNKLNDSYGRMGAEQHLARFPGDSVENMAPGLGGWGYVSDPEVEKYYVAVQTLYLPNWKTDTKRLADWYKFRKVVVVNPKNGKTIIASIADAGPSIWTGKKFGGSPEVMAYLGINYGMQNHPVILFFLDDKDNKVTLGPVEYNVEEAYGKNIL